jgi:soluble lytic murein transglycosylase-like protein
MSLSAPAHAASHLVRRGETLSRIADRYGTSVTRLARMNDLDDPNLIVAGRRLRVPGRAPASSSIHQVSSGETLSGIAARYGTTIARLARVNRIEDPNVIVVGARLKVPRGGAVRGTTPAAVTSIEASLENQARGHGVDSALVKAVAWQESGWRQGARSSAGAIGVMQVMPGTARWINCCLGGHGLNVRKADDNVHLGVMYLRQMLAQMGSVRKALAGYYSGPGNVKRSLNSGQRHYAGNVLALVKRFR